jgi:hypothetical protein
MEPTLVHDGFDPHAGSFARAGSRREDAPTATVRVVRHQATYGFSRICALGLDRSEIEPER